MARIGVFVCWCGTNIAGTVDVEKVAEYFKTYPQVKYSTSYRFMCSDPGQNIILDALKKYQLDRVVVAACSPSLHEKTFRTCVEKGGLNPYLVEMANIREQCSWVHKDKEVGTKKAIRIIRVLVAKTSHNEALERFSIPIEKKALIIGGGITGIQAAIDIASANHKVVLVEREPSIGGRMASFDKTFPTMDCSACILTPQMVTAAQNKNVTIHTYAEIEEVKGYVGNFTVKIRKKARSVNLAKCTGCGICYTKCPVKIPSEFDLGLGKRKAIYVPFPQAVPNVPVIDRENCLYFKKKVCGVCKKVCDRGAIDYEQSDEIIEEKFGSIVVATGFEIFDHSVYGEYGYGKIKDVVTGLHFERMVNAAGPTEGKVIRPSDGKEAHTVVFVQCVGSRDEHQGVPYCSRVCCMYTAKQALLLRDHDKNAQAYVFYIDIRSPGKDYEEFVKRVQDDYGAVYLRGRVSRIFEKGDKLIVWGADTLSNLKIEIEADLVVLASGLVAHRGAAKLAQMLRIPYNKHNFYMEAHPKLAPVETMTSGIFIAGACQFPKDIPDSVATASAAAAKVIGLLNQDKLVKEPLIANVKEVFCSGCGDCIRACPFNAIEEKETEDPHTRVKKIVAHVLEGVCSGCGVCTATCRMGAIDLKGFTNRQIMEQVEVV